MRQTGVERARDEQSEEVWSEADRESALADWYKLPGSPLDANRLPYFEVLFETAQVRVLQLQLQSLFMVFIQPNLERSDLI
jgi:hypothetical protein